MYVHIKNTIITQQSKKGFSFIKQAHTNNNINTNNTNTNKTQTMNNDLNDIFSNIPSNNNSQLNNNNTPNFNFINNTNSNINTNQLENIFNIQSNNNNINLMDNQTNTIPTLIPEQPKFNIEQVYENTTQLKSGNKNNDPFNFVDDLLKNK